MGHTIAVIGGQWGDEGKGKIVDYLAQEFQPHFGVRFNGGANAGHSINNEFGEFALHLVPSTVFTEGAISVLANGVVIDPEALLKELDFLKECGIDTSGLRFSDRCHLTLPWHKLIEEADEKQLGREKIGTTRMGIGPTYSDRVGRNGFRLADFQKSREVWELQLHNLYKRARTKLPTTLRDKLTDLVLGELADTLAAFYERVKDQVVDTENLLWLARQRGNKILLEGAQGVLLDVDYGTYPRVTSSMTTRLGMYQGAGLTPTPEETVVGIFKGYVTRVGEGAFPTELNDEVGRKLRETGNEFGVTTGRARRCGWFDAVLARYAHRLNDFSWIVLTKNDVMDTFPIVKICVAYELDGERIDLPPRNEIDMGRCKPIYEEFPGWQQPTSHIRNFEDLPDNLKRYCQRLEELVGVKIGMISVGPKREETIKIASFS